MSRYAKDTSVSVAKSKAEIEDIVQRYGANGFLSGWEDDRAFVQFKMQNRLIKINFQLPDRNSREFTETPSRRWARDEDAALKAWEQACRQRYRALALYVKAILEAIESGIITFDEGFLPHIVLPNRQTVAQWIQVEAVYESGKMPQKLLPE